MQEILQSILGLQKFWSEKNTPKMSERGVLIRRAGPKWLRDQLSSSQHSMSGHIDDLAAEGSDGKGRKAVIPWFRLYSLSRSPSATAGFYLVYLFDASGEQVYLSLNQGTTRWDGGSLIPVATDVIGLRAEWAREAIANTGIDVINLTTTIELQTQTALGIGYERGNIYAIGYPVNEVPADDILLSHLTFMVRLLTAVYSAQDGSYVPGDVPAEIADLEESGAIAAGKPVHRSGGFRPNPKQRKVIELHAVAVATEVLMSEGWAVTDVGAKKPYDLLAIKDRAELHVEVKGTTSAGDLVVLTRGEVIHHQTEAPSSELFVVHSIKLAGVPESPSAYGGVLHRVQSWEIDSDDLLPVSFRYAVPPAASSLMDTNRLAD